MTQDANESQNLSPAVVVTIGKYASSVGTKLAELYPTDAYPIPDSAVPAEFGALIDSINSASASSQTTTELPAVLVIADTDQADSVVTVLDAIRAGTTTVKPRVWPTFVAGSPATLDGFDAGLNERGTGSCDLVLVMTGSKSPQDQAQALASWLHVKMPAPASVLAELPDSQGRICRYVALGCRTVEPGKVRSTDRPATDLQDVDVAAASELISAELASRAYSDPSVEAANAAVSALSQAASTYSAPDLLSSESTLTIALNKVDRTLVTTLQASLRQIVTDVVTQLSESTGQSRAGGVEETADSTVDSDAGSDAGSDGKPGGVAAGASDSTSTETSAAVPPDSLGRTQTVSQLVLLASKGGLTKMFSRNRMASVAELIEPLAAADVTAAVRSALAQLDSQTAPLVEAAVQQIADEAEVGRKEAALAAQVADALTWNQALATARRQVSIWPTVETAGISRSWGGGVPAARQYVVGSARALASLTEDDSYMPIVDLRTQPQAATKADTAQGSETQTIADPAGAADGSKISDEVDLREGSTSQPQATVLLAQYGLPLAALK